MLECTLARIQYYTLGTMMTRRPTPWASSGLEGRKFGSLVILRLAGKYSHVWVICRCSRCGSECKASIHRLQDGSRTACLVCQPRPCPRCGELDIKMFGRNHNRPDGRQVYCSACQQTFKSQATRRRPQWRPPDSEDPRRWDSYLKHIGLAIFQSCLSNCTDSLAPIRSFSGNLMENTRLSDHGYAALEAECLAGLHGEFDKLREIREKYASH